jgi:hypothetical protein
VQSEAEPALPNPDAYEDLVLRTTLSFADAVTSGDLSRFYEQTAEEFRRGFSIDQFFQAFRGFVEQEVNLSAVAGFRPLFTESPRIGPDGTLELKGHFPTRPSRVVFDYQFVARPEAWRLTGIDLRVVPVAGE